MTARIEQLFNKFMEGSCSQQEFSELMDLLRKNEQEEKVRDLLYEVYQHTARSRRSVSYVDAYGELHTALEPVAETLPARVVVRKSKMPYRRIAVIIVLVALLAAVIRRLL